MGDTLGTVPIAPGEGPPLVQLLRAVAELFEEAIRLGVWHTWAVIAAESELARLRQLAPPR